MSRSRHPSKTIEAAIAELERLGWKVEKSKGKSAHAWGFARCPSNARNVCRNGVFCQNQIWSTPRNPEGHARELLRKARGCVVEKDEEHD
jgi:hypothetical protein